VRTKRRKAHALLLKLGGTAGRTLLVPIGRRAFFVFFGKWAAGKEGSIDMLDMKWIREHEDVLEQMAMQKGFEVSVAALVELDARKRELLRQVEEGRARRNALAQQVAVLKREGAADEASRLQVEAKALAAQMVAAEVELRDAAAACERQLLLMPNRYAPDTPLGLSDADNVEVRRVGEPPAFPFAAKDHMELGEALRLIDVPRGVKTAGSRSYVLTGAGALLHRAVQQLALDLLADRGFTPLEVPVLAREEALVGTGFFPHGRDQTYRLDQDDLWLVGTAEVPLLTYYAGEVVDVAAGPIRLAGVSSCFRREAGSAGRDVRGLYRVHQFAKVEQVVLCRADLAEAEMWLERITGYAEELLAMLELPYRVVRICSGDLGFKNYKQYDIETWMPSRSGYGETHSSSLLLDFQSRRSSIRYRDENGRLRYVYTLNNTAVASPRILIPLLENHQREDGTVRIPAALQPYMRGLETLGPAAGVNDSFAGAR
jgi:seryl-tRNA synthetase